METLKAKDKRSSWLVHSLSAEEPVEVVSNFKRYLRTIKKDSKSSSSQESSDHPPPIPPRNRRKSSSSSPLMPPLPVTSITPNPGDSDAPPPLPARTYTSPPSLFLSPREQRKKYSMASKDSVSVSGTTVIDRRRSFSRRRHASRSPVRSCTIDIGVHPNDRRAFMIGDTCEDYDSLSLLVTTKPITIENSPPPLPHRKSTLQRSTSDVDSYPQNKQVVSMRRTKNSVESPPVEYETNSGGPFFPWNTVAARRTSSRHHRCETLWTCGFYDTPSFDPSVKLKSGKIEDLSSIPRRLPSEALTEVTSSTTIRQRPTAIYFDENSNIIFPETQKHSIPPSEVPAGICRRISSIYEQKKLQSTDAGWRNLPLRNSLMGPDQLNSAASQNTGTHLSRGSSHASTGSSTSTTLGPN